jgi:cytochrome P450
MMQLGGYYLPKGTPVHINLWAIQRDERYWQEAEAFKPERWLGDKTGGDRTGGMAYMPFGLGPRMCIGIKLARKFWRYRP